MKKTKLICVRMPEGVLEKIDHVAKTERYVNRSWVIIKLLKALFECDVEGSIWRIIHSYDPYSDGLEIRVTRKEKNYIQHFDPC